jgi:hypothetical protein
MSGSNHQSPALLRFGTFLRKVFLPYLRLNPRGIDMWQGIKLVANCIPEGKRTPATYYSTIHWDGKTILKLWSDIGISDITKILCVLCSLHTLQVVKKTTDHLPSLQSCQNQQAQNNLKGYLIVLWYYMLSIRNHSFIIKIGPIVTIGVIPVFNQKPPLGWKLHSIKDKNCKNAFVTVTRRSTIKPYLYTSGWEEPRLIASWPLYYKWLP